MDLYQLNPRIECCAVYEKIDRQEPCISYCSKIIYLFSGELTYTSYDNEGKAKKLRLSPGNLLYIPFGTKYALKSKYVRFGFISFYTENPPSCDFLSTVSPENYDPSVISKASLPQPFNKELYIKDFEGEKDLFQELAGIYFSERDYYLDELSSRVKLLLIKVATLTDENALPSAMAENLDSYIRENVHDEISNTELGAVFGYHPFYISKVLKDRKGTTLRQYIIAYRLKLAKKLLEESAKSVNEISEECGFNDPSYFTKTFKNAFGMTPKDYRNLTKEDFI